MRKSNWNALLFSVDSDTEEQERKRFAGHIAKNIIKNELSARQKQILVLYYKEEKSMPEIAQELGVNISTISRTHKRACNTVRNRLREYELL